MNEFKIGDYVEIVKCAPGASEGSVDCHIGDVVQVVDTLNAGNWYRLEKSIFNWREDCLKYHVKKDIVIDRILNIDEI